MRTFDKKFLEFPLCCLSFQDEKLIDKIISYSLVRYSYKIEIGLDARIDKYPGKFPYKFDDLSQDHWKIILAAEELGISIHNMENTIGNYVVLDFHITEYEDKYGNDAWCRIGKQIIFETRDKKFNEEYLRILCAIQSILGKVKKKARITKNRIRFRMFGYKNEEIFLHENPQHFSLLTDRQIGNRIYLLHSKQFISKFTYAKRQTYYSTQLTDEELMEEVKKEKLFHAKRKMNLADDLKTSEIKTEIENLRTTKRGLRLIKTALGS
jgi:hypothetical protein